MSRIGKVPIKIPPIVKVGIILNEISAQGPYGEAKLNLPPFTIANIKENQIFVNRIDNSSKSKAMHGLARSLVKNLIEGVSKGYEKNLEIHGVGFKALVKDNFVVLNLGFSHSINYQLPFGVKVLSDNVGKLTIKGFNKQVVGKVASEIRSYYPPEPYKGKGIRYYGEKVTRKEGKTVQ